MKIIYLLILSVCLFSAKPSEYFSNNNIITMYDSSANFITITYSSNIEMTIGSNVNRALEVYQKYNISNPKTKLNGIVWWFGNISVVFDRFWIANYFKNSDKKVKAFLIYKKIADEL